MCEIEQNNIRDALENYKENKNKDLSSTPQVWYTIQQQEKEFLGGAVQSRVGRGRAKVGDGNCREGYSRKAS